MDVPSSTSRSTGPDAGEPSGSFLATVRHRLGGSSFALPSLLDGEHEVADHTPPKNGGGGPNKEIGDEEEDLEELMWDAQVSATSERPQSWEGWMEPPGSTAHEGCDLDQLPTAPDSSRTARLSTALDITSSVRWRVI